MSTNRCLRCCDPDCRRPAAAAARDAAWNAEGKAFIQIASELFVAEAECMARPAVDWMARALAAEHAMSTDRCPRCDRADCRREVTAHVVAAASSDESMVAVSRAYQETLADCDAHAVDWRAWALGAEWARDAAITERDAALARLVELESAHAALVADIGAIDEERAARRAAEELVVELRDTLLGAREYGADAFSCTRCGRPICEHDRAAQGESSVAVCEGGELARVPATTGREGEHE